MTKRIFLNMALVAAIAIVFDSILSNIVLRKLGTEYIWLSFLISAAAILGVTAAAWFVTKAIVRPIRSIDPEKGERSENYAEITPLLTMISDRDAEIDRRGGELLRKELELQLIMNNMSEGLLIFGKDGEILSVNRSASRLLEEIPDYAERDVFLRLRETALSGKHMEYTLRHDGEVFRLMADPVTAEDIGGGVRGAVLIAINVTEEEGREQLRREFTSNVSHELKTPLTTIYGISDMLVGGLVPAEDTGRFLSEIQKEASRMISLIDDIIKLSRLDEGDSRLQTEEVELSALVSEILDRLRVQAEKRNVTLRLIGEHVVYTGVRSVLDEMICNLCDNAVKYNKEGGMVTVSVYRDGGRPCIAVEDTGIGIPMKEQSRVFERFYRVDKSHSRKIGGTGLGLSIVKHAVAYHGGTVSLDSTEGVGTKIVVTL